MTTETKTKTIYDLFSEFIEKSAKNFDYYLEWNKEEKNHNGHFTGIIEIH